VKGTFLQLAIKSIGIDHSSPLELGVIVGRGAAEHV